MRSIRDRARKVFSDEEFNRIVRDRPAYDSDVALIHRESPSVRRGHRLFEETNVWHFDMM
jgi:hypothetical protein